MACFKWASAIIGGVNHQKERFEAELARRIPEINLEQKLRAADRRAVALALPEGLALVEFVRFNVFNFEVVYVHRDQRWKPPPTWLSFYWRANPTTSKCSTWEKHIPSTA